MSFGKETMAEVPESIQSARETAREIMSASHEDVDLYVRTRRRLELALINVRGSGSKSYLGFSSSPRSIGGSFDCSHPAVRAAFLTSAVAYKAWVYTHAHKKVPLFTEIWKYWNTARIAGETSELVERLTPVAAGLFTGVNLERIRYSFWEAIRGGVQEGIIITGLDGSGKSTLTGALVRFLEQLGLRVSRENFPRRDSTIGALARSVLTGGERVDPRSLQLLMIADALDYPWTDSALPVYDRHPIADALVYSPPGAMEVALLAARELFASSPTWLIIVDRHPVNCRERIHARAAPPRAI